MRKLLGVVGASLSYLSFSALAFAQEIELKRPTGSAEDVKIENIPQFIVSILFVIGIVIAIAFLIYGGIKWILSGGDKTAVESARNHIVSAIVGLVIVIAAFFILNVVIKIITGNAIDLNHLCIPSLANPTCK